MKVLLAYDNQAVASGLQIMLGLEGHEVRSAQNGPDGYWVYFQFQPDLVITDFQIPRENGFELMNHIREHDPTVKIIYMSYSLDQSYLILKEERSNYPINFLEKPFSSQIKYRSGYIISPRCSLAIVTNLLKKLSYNPSENEQNAPSDQRLN